MSNRDLERALEGYAAALQGKPPRDPNAGRDSILALIIFAAAIPSTSLLRAFVLTELWGWFVTPLGAPMLTMAWAFGLTCILALVTYRAPVADTPRKDAPPPLKTAIHWSTHWIVQPLAFWGLGWLAHWVGT